MCAWQRWENDTCEAFLGHQNLSEHVACVCARNSCKDRLICGCDSSELRMCVLKQRVCGMVWSTKSRQDNFFMEKLHEFL